MAQWRLLAAGMAVGALCVGGASAEALTLAPHRATYELFPAPGSAGKDAQLLEGLIVFELADACDGYTMTDRRVFVLGRGDGRTTTFDSIYSAWESADGERFDFASTLHVDGHEVETVRGSATLDRPGGAGTVAYKTPEEKRIALPQGTYFPVHAGRHSIEMIAAGERQLSYKLFDGSDSDGAVLAADFVTRSEMAEARKQPQGDVGLLQARSWRVRTAFFDLDEESAPPSAEFDGQTHENGVISRFLLDTDAFAAIGELVRIEALPASGC